MHRRAFGAGLGGLALVAARAGRAAAQGEGRWPSREIAMITGFGPGAATDLIARTLAAHMEKTLGVSVIVRNTPGAGGTLGPGRVAQSRPDGYTFGLVAASAVLVAPLTMDLPYKPWESFDFLAGTSELRISVAVGPSLPEVRTLADFVAAGRRRRISFASTNPGSAVSFFDLARLTGADLSYVAFGSLTDAAAQVAGGHLDAYTGTVESIPLVRGGQVRMLASASVDRWPEFPDVPTLRELGYDTVTRQLVGFAGPAGLPPAIRDRLEAALLAAARDPAVQARLEGASIASRPMGRDEYLAALREVQPAIEAALRAAGMVRPR
jgi:tripartite-type tricarboxylate transporter receptor subunit TctC